MHIVEGVYPKFYTLLFVEKIETREEVETLLQKVKVVGLGLGGEIMSRLPYPLEL
jgi:hypothetical protein